MNLFWVSYFLSPRFCHRFVGYLEEEAVKTYTHCIEVSVSLHMVFNFLTCHVLSTRRNLNFLLMPFISNPLSGMGMHMYMLAQKVRKIHRKLQWLIRQSVLLYY